MTMKKLLSVSLALCLTLTLFAACGNSKGETTPPAETAAPEFTGTMAELLDKIVAARPVEFSGEILTIDLGDTSEEGLWSLQSHTGLETGESLADAAFFEPMMGSIAYSMVAVRVKPGEDVKAVAQAMVEGINPRKWVCVEANDIRCATAGDVALFVMLDDQLGLTAQSFLDAFAQVTQTQPETIK